MKRVKKVKKHERSMKDRLKSLYLLDFWDFISFMFLIISYHFRSQSPKVEMKDCPLSLLFTIGIIGPPIFDIFSLMDCVWWTKIPRLLDFFTFWIPTALQILWLAYLGNTSRNIERISIARPAMIWWSCS